MAQEKAKHSFMKYFKEYIKRPGAEELLAWMEVNGFFEAPASKKHHGAKPGGLAEHSVNVFRRLLRLKEEERKRGKFTQYDVETYAICGLLHDLCKTDAYRLTEGQQGKTEYQLTKNFPAGHGEKSVILILQFMNLTKEEILAIRWHMGQYDFYARGGGYDLDNAFRQCKLAVMLHIADMMATHLDEDDSVKEGSEAALGRDPEKDVLPAVRGAGEDMEPKKRKYASGKAKEKDSRRDHRAICEAGYF